MTVPHTPQAALSVCEGMGHSATATQLQMTQLAQLDLRHQELIRELESRSSVFSLAEVEPSIDVAPALHESLRLLTQLREVLDEKLSVSRNAVDVTHKDNHAVGRSQRRLDAQVQDASENQPDFTCSQQVLIGRRWSQNSATDSTTASSQTGAKSKVNKSSKLKWASFRKKILSSHKSKQSSSSAKTKKLFRTKSLSSSIEGFPKPSTDQSDVVVAAKKNDTQRSPCKVQSGAKQSPSVTTSRSSECSSQRYCTCGEPFNDAMVACDDKGCAIEWFHFRCVGLKAAPRGRWYCNDCAKNQNIRETPKRQAKLC